MTRDQAITLARRYLDAMEARDLDGAATYLSDDVVLTFPGGRALSSVHDIVRNSAGRYRRVGKIFENWDCFEGEGGRFVVYARGTLHGEWNDGRAFAGIRFIDRFEIDGGTIRRQDVWNDIGEYRLAAMARESSAT